RPGAFERETVITMSGDDHPRAFVLDECQNLMFWTNWNEQHPSIMRAALSGANVLTLIEKDIRTPNGLAIDHRAEKLYFSDATLDKIERCEYDGSHRYVNSLHAESTTVAARTCVCSLTRAMSTAHAEGAESSRMTSPA
ncbi:LRP1 isoform 8, partial [Pan troglodytes]